MKGKIFIVHWDKKEGSEIKDRLEALGFETELETEDGIRAFDNIDLMRPDVVLVYLTKRPSIEITSVASVLDKKTLTDIPTLFVGDEDEKVAHFGEMLSGSEVLPRDKMITALTEVLNRKWA